MTDVKLFMFLDFFVCVCFNLLSVQLDIIQASRVASDMFLVMLERFKTPSVMRAYARSTHSYSHPLKHHDLEV